MKYIIILFVFIIPVSLQAQQPDLVFHHLTEKDGLSYNIINCFLKDSRGMLWIGTYNGLNRYDGAHFYIFRKGRDKNSLPDNTVHELTEDKDANIWGATDNGIFCYNQRTNSFKNYNGPNKDEWPVFLNILCDKQGVIWSSCNKGLIRFNAKADRFEMAPSTDTAVYPGKGMWINKNGLSESPDGKGFWLACAVGMVYYDKTTRQFTSAKNNSDSILYAPRAASGLCATNYGHYWYFDNKKKRLVGFDPVNKKVKYNIQGKGIENMSYIATIFEDNNHLLWVCTWGYQLFTIDYLNGNTIKRIMHRKNDRSSVAGDFFWDVMHENDGTLWLGTVGGISRCNTNHSFYKIHRFTDSLSDSNNPEVTFVTENKIDSTWWVTTNKSLLLHYNPVTSKVTSYDFTTMPKNKAGQWPVQVLRMLFFKNKVMLFSQTGAWVKDGAGGFKPLVVPGIGDSVILQDAAVIKDSLIYCTDHKKVWQWNIRSNKVIQLQYTTDFTPDEGKVAIYFTVVNDRLWMVSGYNWMCYVENDKMIPVQFSTKENDGRNGFYTTMAGDKTGNLWISKKGEGLINYSISDKKYRLFKQYDGLVMDHIMAVAPDNNGKIWTASYNQFSVYNPLLNSFYNFTLPISSNKYTYVNYMTTLANGNVIGNVAAEIVEFFPARLKAYSVNTTPLISTASVAGVEKLVPGNNIISLAPGESSILLKFGLLADYEASPYDMLYILEGSEKNWSVAGNNFEATYNSLQPGDYTFKVKALAKDKSWQTKEAVLKIHVGTPFYKSWWFITLLGFVCATGIYAFYRYRLHQQQQVMQLESKAQLLEKEKTTVMYESLKQQLNPHFLFNSLTSLSGLIDTDQKLAGNFLEQMSKLYRYILKSSENETVPLKDEINFVKLFIGLQKTRFKKGLEVNIDIPEEYLHYKIAPVTLQNMMENAIKHNIIDTDSPLVIDMYVEDEYVVVKNNLQKKNVVETSNRQGLTNLRSLYHYLSERPILVEEDEKYFAIKIPLI